MISPFTQNEEIREVLYKVFEFSTPTDNVKHTEVCMSWRAVASVVAKKQIVQFKIEDIQRKTAKFLEMVPEKLEFYCPTYANLLKMDLKAHSIKQVYDITLKATQKHPQPVCIVCFLHVRPEDPNIPDNRREGLAGKTFVQLHHDKMIENTPRPYVWGIGEENSWLGVDFLPIELFNLTVCGADENYVVHGDKDNGTVCFAFRGRFIELKLYEGTNDLKYLGWHSHDGLGHLNRDSACISFLTNENARAGNYWPQNFYIPELHAKEDTK